MRLKGLRGDEQGHSKMVYGPGIQQKTKSEELGALQKGLKYMGYLVMYLASQEMRSKAQGHVC